MFSRRDLLAASAMGAAMTVTAANAGSFGNPDAPPQGAINAKNPASASDPGPQDPAIRDQLSSAFSPPPTDVGGMPQIWSSFNTVQRRIQNGALRARCAGGRSVSRDCKPTPTGLVADAIQDVSRRGDLAPDLFLGSGTTLLAAGRNGRRFAHDRHHPQFFR
jgi:oxalate decarboxylase